ncbi:hypothetical protein TPHA_0B00220 [Tetrapisispora phaffii CBS 4417]|uniref:Thioesterase domain-containing protein n=1 Tax=Tetrapisispora phaffii (strain ATCC 24235 / CBS 4417 / NBRC 1672 / NRRL Y-8282 / UCD 70-5) TaxID=1071381 RepID=G8BQ97_TETPH|nr:hypothetical protein TPHA_0B00220 [Tetrapisispora phaffii CBS 4417]CCE61694.1 hypothetical protein TPHA_0B00220 [Tetrapisispora phaffii CBS 4417]
MFRRSVGQLFKRTYTQTKFVTNAPRRRWIPYTVFGVSFFSGWLLTQHMTYTDLVAYWRYDKLPSDSEEVNKYKLNLTNRLMNLDVVKGLEAKGYHEVFPVQYKENSSSVANSNKDTTEGKKLISDTLSVPGAIAIPPKFYYDPKTKETIGIYHLGMKLTGYPFLIHGGILATVIEDQMRESVKLIKNKVPKGIKDITVSYKLPTLANQFVVVRTTKVEEFGNNIKLSIEMLDQTGERKLVSARGTFST